MADVESGGARPAMRRYIKESDGSVDYETSDPEERKLRFTAAISHAGLVKLLQNAGGSIEFDATPDTLDDLFHYEVAIHAKDTTASLTLYRKPETNTGEPTPVTQL